MEIKNKYDVIVIGGGAAGLMCAGLLKSKKVLVLEKNKDFGKKILVSGGGRCNFTNYDVSAENFQSENEHFCKSALKRYNSYDFIDLVEKYEVQYYEKKLGQLFCKKSAKDILNILISECKGHATLLKGVDILSLNISDKIFEVELSNGKFYCDNIVVATGGLSFPKIGATDYGYQVAKKFGHKIINPIPALVPFTLSEVQDEGFNELAGVSLPVQISVGDQTFFDDLLFTHKGLSGPAILKASLYWNSGDHIEIDFTNGIDLEAELQSIKNKSGKMTLLNFLKGFFPKKFIQKWMALAFIEEDKNISDISNQDFNKLHSLLSSWRTIPSGTEGFRKAEVTRGGVSTEKLSSKTMESQLQSGLYFIGEVVDMTGWLGGYNFQWAWSSAHACAQHLSTK